VHIKTIAMNQKKFKIGDRFKSFKFAFNGVRILFFNEHNAWIHLAATILVIIAGIAFKISVLEWAAIFIAIGLVFLSEAINTAIEKLSDFVSHEKQNSIKEVKDLAAAGVLISAITALLIGLFVFLPEILTLFGTK
jgi:diacylglycerol kinase (ATP)